jgi:hypothetical protein
MLSFVFIAGATYPFWGFALFYFFCKWATSKFGPAASGFRKVALVSPVAAGLFSPVLFGTEGFAWATHWSVALFQPRATSLYFPFLGVTFVLAVLFSFEASRNTVQKKVAHGRRDA